MTSTVGAPHLVMLGFFSIVEPSVRIECMKRRCFKCYVFTEFESNLIVHYHTSALSAHLVTYDLLPLLWTEDCTVSIKLEKKFVNSFTKRKKELIILVCFLNFVTLCI